MCGLVRIPGPALDAFVLRTIRQTLLGDAGSTKHAVNAFVDAVFGASDDGGNNSKGTRELEQLDRRIKATIGMIGDPSFEGLDDLRKVLADLKKKRDTLMAAIVTHDVPVAPETNEDAIAGMGP